MVLWAPRGLHRDPACVRHRIPCHCNLLEEACLRLPADGLGDYRYWRTGLCCLGTPHVHGRHVTDTAILLHVGHNGHCGSNGGKDFLMDRHNVGRLN